MSSSPPVDDAVGTGGPLAVALNPLRRPGFRNLWISSAFFFSAYWAQMVILGWLAFDLTRSEFAVALFGAVGFAPFLLGPLGGFVADRADRPRLLRGSNVFALAIAVAVAALVALDAVAYWHVVLAGFLTGLTQAPLMPSRFTLVMDLVGRESLSSANALNMATQRGGRIIGPALSGVLIAAYGADVALVFAAAWYVPAFLWLLPSREIDRGEPARHSQILPDIVDGFRVALRHPALRIVLAITVAANALVWPVIQSFLPVFAEEAFDVGPTGLGLLVAVNGVGALAGAILIAMLGDFQWKGWLFLGSTACLGLSLSLFAVSPTMSLALLGMLVSGLAGSGFAVQQSTLVLLLSPDYARGRIAGVLMLSISSMPLGMLVQGAIAAQVGVVPTTVVVGGALALVTLATALASPALRRI